MRSHACGVVALAVMWVLTASVPSTAQVKRCGPGDVVPWWPRFYANAGAETLAAAERATIEARLLAVESLMRKTNYATPRGFAVIPRFNIHEIRDRTQLYPYSFALQTALRCSKYDEHAADLRVLINPDPMTWSQGDRPWPEERGDGQYREMIRTPALFGSTATFGRFHAINDQGLVVLFTTGGESPTLPVSREEYLRAQIFALEGKDQEKVKEAAALVSKTPYERWMEDAPARKKRNDEMLAVITQVAPAEAAKVRADMERNELAETEKLRKADAFERAQLGKNMAALTAAGDTYRAQIAAMTPKERSSPAFLLGYDLVPAGTPQAYAMVRKNPAFYRARNSPFEPRAIVVMMPNTHKEYWDEQERLYKELDWAAIKKMVNPER